MMTCDELRESCTLYALGILTGEELSEVEAHLRRGCPACTREVEGMRRVTDLLRFAAPAAGSNGEAKARLFERLGLPGQRSLRPARPARRPASWWLPAFAAAAAGVVVAAGAAWYALDQRERVRTQEAAIHDLTQQLAAARQAVSQAASPKAPEVMAAGPEADLRGRPPMTARGKSPDDVVSGKVRIDPRAGTRPDDAASGRARPGPRPPQREDQIAAILKSPETTVIGLKPADPAGRQSAKVHWNPERGLYLTASGLPPLAKDRRYHLWISTGTGPVHAGALTPDARGNAVLYVAGLPDLREVRDLTVTDEPVTGARLPTGPTHLVGRP
jgi:hypothetical protein